MGSINANSNFLHTAEEFVPFQNSNLNPKQTPSTEMADLMLDDLIDARCVSSLMSCEKTLEKIDNIGNQVLVTEKTQINPLSNKFLPEPLLSPEIQAVVLDLKEKFEDDYLFIHKTVNNECHCQTLNELAKNNVDVKDTLGFLNLKKKLMYLKEGASLPSDIVLEHNGKEIEFKDFKQIKLSENEWKSITDTCNQILANSLFIQSSVEREADNTSLSNHTIIPISNKSYNDHTTETPEKDSQKQATEVNQEETKIADRQAAIKKHILQIENIKNEKYKGAIFAREQTLNQDTEKKFNIFLKDRTIVCIKPSTNAFELSIKNGIKG